MPFRDDFSAGGVGTIYLIDLNSLSSSIACNFLEVFIEHLVLSSFIEHTQTGHVGILTFFDNTLEVIYRIRI